MAILAEINLYPIKSCAGIALQEATLTHHGIMHADIYDREWMLVDADNRFLSQREVPRLALVAPTLKPDTLELRFPGMLAHEVPLALPDPDDAATVQVHIWDEQFLAYDCDAHTAAWFSQALGLPCRLVRFHADEERLCSTSWTGGVASPTLFSDGYPVLVAGSASLADVNEKLLAAGRAAIPMNRFRPNLVLDGIEAFEEDYADTLQFGATALKAVKPCPRCPIPSVDQASGVVGPDPLDVLQGYRAKPELDGAICFGMNCIVSDGGDEIIRIGQEITVNLAF